MIKKIAIGMLVLLTAAFAGCGGSGGGGGTAGGATLLTVPESGVESAPVSSDEEIPPYILVIDGVNNGGNRTCAEVGEAYFGDPNYYAFSSDRINYEDGVFDQPLPAGINVATDGTYVDWTSTFGIGAVIVKGGNDANVYVYEPQVNSDSGLAAPPNASGNPAGLSNITFCWNPEEEACFEYESAWSDGTRFVSKGNWATYTAYAGEETTVTLYAGQTLEAGEVTFSAPVDGAVTITIQLNAGWSFDAAEENVHIQGFDTTPPAQNPAPGQFANKASATGDTYSVEVPAANYYGVHVNVKQQVECL
jgi:hypothetical protein